MAQRIYRYIAEWDTADPIHGDNCWQAVIRMLRESHIISAGEAAEWRRDTTQENYSHLFPRDCPIAYNEDDWYAIEAGCLVGFFKFDSDGRRYLAHAAIACGSGRVAGTNGSGVGLPNYLDLSDLAGIHWIDGDRVSYTYDAGRHRIPVQIRYRDIDDVGSSCAIL